MRLAANLNSMWAELPYLDRFEAASVAGFDAVAVPMPYEAPAKDTQRATQRSILPVVQISTPPPNYTGGERGFAAVPGLEARFRYDLRRALRYCEVLRVPTLHVMAGIAEGAAARATLLSNLRHAISVLPDGVTLTLQPQAQRGAFLGDFDRAAEIVETIGSDRLGLQFHSQHAQVLGRDAVSVFRTHAGMIRHVQIGDAPGGGAPGTGEIDFDALFETFHAHGYGGWIVADYRSDGATDDSLRWMSEIAPLSALMRKGPVGSGTRVHG